MFIFVANFKIIKSDDSVHFPVINLLVIYLCWLPSKCFVRQHLLSLLGSPRGQAALLAEGREGKRRGCGVTGGGARVLSCAVTFARPFAPPELCRRWILIRRVIYYTFGLSGRIRKCLFSVCTWNTCFNSYISLSCRYVPWAQSKHDVADGGKQNYGRIIDS